MWNENQGKELWVQEVKLCEKKNYDQNRVSSAKENSKKLQSKKHFDSIENKENNALSMGFNIPKYNQKTMKESKSAYLKNVMTS